MLEQHAHNVTAKQRAKALRRASKIIRVDTHTYGEICHMFEAAAWEFGNELAKEGISSGDFIELELDDDEALRFTSDEARHCARVVSGTPRWRKKHGFRSQITRLECELMMGHMWLLKFGTPMPDDSDLRDRHEMLAERMFKLLTG